MILSSSIAMFAALSQPQAEASEPEAGAPIITMQPEALPIEQQTALRCSIAIAIVTERQRMGQATDASWPDLTQNERGREFFVRNLAQLMDDARMSRETLAAYGRRETQELLEPGRLEEVMPACLLMLDASGL